MKALLRILKPERVQELLDVILPSGDTLLHILVSSPCDYFEALIKYVEEHKLNLRLLPNLKGVTPLHLCVRDSMSTNSSRILKILGRKPLDDHSSFIKDLLPDLLKLCPLALAEYLDQRLIQVTWTPKFTDGKLDTPTGCDFAVVPLNMFPLSQEDMKKALFDDASDYVDVRLPLLLVIADIPDLHRFSNATGKDFLKQLSLVKHSGILFSKRYIQSLVEVKWPPIRRALIHQIFLPYLAYLMLFNYYAFYLIYDREGTFDQVLTYGVQVCLIVLTAHTIANEVKEYRAEPELYSQHMWNYLDVLPKLLVLLAILVDFFTTDASSQFAKNLLASLYAISMFLLWINILNFLRLFRNTGYLIHLILQVIKDMRYFLAVIGVTLLSFSGAFYILSRSNTEKGDFLDSSFLEASGFTYQLLLGQFNPESFGEQNLGLTWLFFVLATLFLIVVMLNLLISIISATFERVQSQAKQRMYHEFAQLIVENYHLLSPETMKELDSRGRYLYLAWLEESMQANEGEVVCEKLGSMLAKHRKEVVRLVDERLRAEEIPALHAKIDKLSAQLQQALAPSKNA